jgi:hypothetical protein
MGHQEGAGEPRRCARVRVVKDKRDIKKVVNQSNSELPSSSATWSSGAPSIQIDIQIAYDLHFGRSTYAWAVYPVGVH